MKGNPKISIIIPVYNIEGYLTYCLDSLFACDLSDTEILLIDDGSADSSGAVCDRYAGKIPAAKVLHKANGGLSDARNCGMRAANGEWVIFIDGDDSVIPDRYDKYRRWLLGLGESTDVVLNDFFIDDRQNAEKREIRQIDSESSTLERVLRKPESVWNVWRWAYRREFLDKIGLKFKTGYLAEDLDFTARILSFPDLKISFTHIPYYLYVYRRAGSITGTMSLKFVYHAEKQAVYWFFKLLKRKETDMGLLRRKLIRDAVLTPLLYIRGKVGNIDRKQKEKTVSKSTAKGERI